MPELPEVETTINGIRPFVEGHTIQNIIIRHHGLRWPIPKNIPDLLAGEKVLRIHRRAKYILLETRKGTLLIHLGMSGSLRILKEFSAPKKHDHVDIVFSHNIILRYTDPRRFGAILWTDEDPDQHALLDKLGPEPLKKLFSGKYLHKQAQGKKIAIKSFIMNNKVVVGVGNIYATEALFQAGIHPSTLAGKISRMQFDRLVVLIKKILRSAIRQGGTTIKDFSNSDGKPGYFSQKLKAYGRAGLPCVKCGSLLKSIIIGQRNSVFCPGCQSK